MPCTYYTPEEERQMAADTTRELVKQVNELTKLLCDISHNIDEDTTHNLIRKVDGFGEWLSDHQERDRKAGRK